MEASDKEGRGDDAVCARKRQSTSLLRSSVGSRDDCRWGKPLGRPKLVPPNYNPNDERWGFLGTSALKTSTSSHRCSPASLGGGRREAHSRSGPRRRRSGAIRVRQTREELHTDKQHGHTITGRETAARGSGTRHDPSRVTERGRERASRAERASRRKGARVDPASLFPLRTMNSVLLWRANSASNSATLAAPA